jgi:hypothetical protein
MPQTANEKAVKNMKDMNAKYTSAQRVEIETEYNRAKAEGEPEA